VGGCGSSQAKDRYGRGQTLHNRQSERLDVHGTLSETSGVRGDEDRARHGHLLHPGGEMGGLADSGIVHVEIAPDRPDDDFTGVQADPNVERYPVAFLDLLRVLRDCLLHPQSRVASAYCMVLLGERRAEERHDAVAHDLVDGALVAVDGLHHVFENGIEEPASLLWVAVGEKLHRALQVSKEDCDLLALTF
jgi:hypothetical protein